MGREKWKQLSQRWLCTVVITWIYCEIWIIVEKLIHGQNQRNPVDDIMMMLFIPIIWLATKPIYDKFAQHRK